METEHWQTSVLVADHQVLFRHGLIGLMRDVWPEWLFEQAGSFEAALDAVAAGESRLVLLDLDLPGMGGAEGVQHLRMLEPDCVLVVLADTDDRATILDCLSAGAQGYILKSATPEQFLHAMRTVLSGGVFAPASLAGRPVPAQLALSSVREDARPVADIAPIVSQFTERQREVFNLLAEGCATKTIARRLNLAVGTVKVHLAAIYRALGAHSRLEALAKARNSLSWTAPLPSVGRDVRPREQVRAYLG